MAGLLEVRDRVQRYLTDFLGGINVAQNGDFNFQHGSTHVVVRVYEGPNEANFVNVFAFVLSGVKGTPELYRHIALNNNFRFGSICLVDNEEESGTHNIIFAHTLLGDFLDAEELKWAVGAVAGTADTLDDELKEKFGGKRVHEDITEEDAG